ncbi:phosphofructokinase 4 [Prunus dulcis]|uniref:ATP-dependent 6-phosphofructokinase n=1 Tax=Prunus dulcis TaxID=3755 RepID=A0A4Y1R2B5_PRUDU|nr:phosphofructokinase 4 [Prunus dulcis]
MQNGVVENGVCSSASVNGSHDVWSSNESDSSSADHLVVMVHGIMGSAADWKFGAEQFVKMLPDKVFVHCSERNGSRLTLDGVDVMGERLTEEVVELTQRKPNLRKISFIGHSVGGLVARYAIGRLYRPPKNENSEHSSPNGSEEDPRSTLCGLEPMNFITVATPHLGSRGRHLFLNDDDDGKPPLLKRMIEDYDEYIVGWRTSSIRRNSELPKWEDTVDEKYPHIVYEEHCKAYDAEQCEPTSVEIDGSDKLEVELLTGLSRVCWEKVDVSFHCSRHRFAAHSVIQSNCTLKRASQLLPFGRYRHHATENQNAAPPRVRYWHAFFNISFAFSSLLSSAKFVKSSEIPMESAISSPLSTSSHLLPSPSRSSLGSRSQSFPSLQNLRHPSFKSRCFLGVPFRSRQTQPIRCQSSNQQPAKDDGFVIEDVPHLTDFLSNLPSYPNPLKQSQAYAVVKQTFVSTDDVVAQKVVVQKDDPRGVHFRRAGPREKVYFKSDEVRACIVTCGGLCPGINTVIREIVCGLNYMYGVEDILGIEGGYRGFYSKNTLRLTPKVVNDIHKRGGTFLRTSRGGHDTNKIVDNIQDRGINQVYIIGGDGTQKGAALIYKHVVTLAYFVKEVEKRGLQVAVAGIPKTIDNDIAVIDKSFGFDTAVEEAQRAINAAHVEVESVENGVGIVKLMGRYSGFIALYATLASRDVDCCLVPESPFYLEGRGGLFEFVEERLKENGHVVIVLAEGAGQEYVAQEMQVVDGKDASGNKLLLDVGLWLTEKIKDHFTKVQKMAINTKYIDPTYMIRAIPSNASDNIYCTLLAQSAVHGAMAGFSGFTVGPVNSRHAYIPISVSTFPAPIVRVTETQNTVNLTDRMWARLLASTNQPSFLESNELHERVDKEDVDVINHNMRATSI